MGRMERQTAAFPRLQHLNIRRCPKLKELSEQLLRVKRVELHSCERLSISGYDIETTPLERIEHSISSTSLRIGDCPNMSIPLGCCYDFLETLGIYGGCDSLTNIPLDFFPRLSLLQLCSCCNVQMISQEHTHNNFKHLYISGSPQFESFPSEGLSTPSIVKFSLEKLENLKLLPKGMHILLPSLTELEIIDCPQEEMFCDGGLPSNIKSVRSLKFETYCLIKRGLGSQRLSTNLSIVRVDVESFSGEGFLPLSYFSANR
ncbi:hypothetical protein Fmac_016898 [Flemingia macrophylla]|uniref:Uncharacterized protein n=1 Tax=Flemingia macrophylla TaxID=520843 RepID=A0ABD1MIP2_9FABA